MDVESAAVQFPLAHPAVVGVLAGTSSANHVVDLVERLRAPLPASLFVDAKAAGLLADRIRCPHDQHLCEEVNGTAGITGVRTVLDEYPSAHAPSGTCSFPWGRADRAELAVFLETDEGPLRVGDRGRRAQPFVHALGDGAPGS